MRQQSLQKSKIKFLLLEGIHSSAVDALAKAGYDNVVCYSKALPTDELIAERECLLKSDEMKKFVWYSADLQETLIRCHRQSFKNDASDFADSELLLQDFIRRYSDDTLEKPLKVGRDRIGQ